MRTVFMTVVILVAAALSAAIAAYVVLTYAYPSFRARTETPTEFAPPNQRTFPPFSPGR
jgi:tetrahydromethanopterin S-methyltransferase subunit E